jgi:hypothetical protein
MELFEVPIAESAVLSIVFLGNLVPLGVIAAIYWYMIKKADAIDRPQPAPMLGGRSRAA